MTETMTSTADLGGTGSAPIASELTPDNPFDPVVADVADADVDVDATDVEAERRRIGAWLEVGATSIPAFLVAVGSALVGTVAMFIRRRRRR